MERQSFLIPIAINLISGGVLATFLKVMPSEIFLIFIILISACYYSYEKFIYKELKVRIIAFCILAIGVFLFVYLSYVFISFYPNRLPLSGEYWKWKNTDTVHGNGSSLMPIIYSNNAIEVVLNKPEEIENSEIYINIGHLYPTSDEAWLLEVRYSENFEDFKRGAIKIELPTPYLRNDMDIWVYLTNKPKMGDWIPVSNYDRRYLREVFAVE